LHLTSLKDAIRKSGGNICWRADAGSLSEGKSKKVKGKSKGKKFNLFLLFTFYFLLFTLSNRLLVGGHTWSLCFV